ncbi:MAG: twin-arginine translocase TatA/TatE family subunit [Chloroflexota bacterium]
MGLPNIGPLELIIVLAIALLVVGPGKLPEMGSAFWRTIREFRKSASGLSDITDTGTADPQADIARQAPTPTAVDPSSTSGVPTNAAGTDPADESA